MNYRHSFHAGNFADLVKHAIVLALVERMQVADGPLAVVDTHAGAGLYDLSGDGARSKEAEAGVARLMTAEGRPAALEALAERVRARNGDGAVRWYPGSPLLVAEGLRSGDRYRGYELRPEECERLAEALKPFAGAVARNADGYAAVVEGLAGKAEGRTLVLIDPPFERGDDYQRAAETAGAIVTARPGTTVAIWTPIKDMETFDGFLRRLAEAGGDGALVAEARLRPLTDPMKMNGCAMVMLNPPDGMQAVAEAVCDWVARELGQAGGRGEVWTL